MARYTNSDVFDEERVHDEIINSSPKVDVLAGELRALTKNIHALFLFEEESRNLLQKLCLLIGSAAEGRVYFNWMHFADHLKVRNVVVRNIDNWLKRAEGPVEPLLKHYVQKYDATLDRVIYALEKTKREDVIFQINDDVKQLEKRVHSCPEFKDAWGIYRSPNRLLVPLMLEAEKNSPVDSNDDSCQISYGTRENNERVIKVTRNKEQVAMTVMLTCAEDGEEAEERIAKKLRALWPKIGVVVLREQYVHLWAKHQGFVNDCVKQVHVVMPILTEGYIEAINGRAPKNGIQPMFNVNKQFVKYIYDSMSLEYQKDGCNNKRIRCILPNNVTNEILEINPELSTYFGEEQLEVIIRYILAEKEKAERRLRRGN